MLNKIAFILCVNNDLYFEECSYYINRLIVPEGYEVEIIGIREAASMCSAYNFGMQSTDAKYKVYMHQDVFIKNINFIEQMLDIFQLDSQIGMIGVAGGIGMPKTGVAYLAWNAGMIDCREPDMAYYLVCAPDVEKDIFVDAVDGLLMATQYDVPWREDLFHNFDFYDVSQSFEMRRRGYKILVPYQPVPWVIHDSGFAKLTYYDANRKICLKEYPEYFTEENGFPFHYEKEWEELSEALAMEVRKFIAAGDWETVGSIISSYRRNQMKNSALEMYGVMFDIYQKEKTEKIEKGFFTDCGGYEDVYRKYITVRFLLRRVEMGMPEREYMELLEALEKETVSCEAVVIMILHTVLNKKEVLCKVERYYQRIKQSGKAIKIAAFYEKVKDRELPVAYSKRVSSV